MARIRDLFNNANETLINAKDASVYIKALLNDLESEGISITLVNESNKSVLEQIQSFLGGTAKNLDIKIKLKIGDD